MIGRTRSRAAIIAASARVTPDDERYIVSAYSTTKMAFLAARPISITSEICIKILFTYTALTICAPTVASNAPTTATGTLIRIANGKPQLLYNAAKARKTKTNASR